MIYWRTGIHGRWVHRLSVFFIHIQGLPFPFFFQIMYTYYITTVYMCVNVSIVLFVCLQYLIFNSLQYISTKEHYTIDRDQYFVYKSAVIAMLTSFTLLLHCSLWIIPGHGSTWLPYAPYPLPSSTFPPSPPPCSILKATLKQPSHGMMMMVVSLCILPSLYILPGMMMATNQYMHQLQSPLGMMMGPSRWRLRVGTVMGLRYCSRWGYAHAFTGWWARLKACCCGHHQLGLTSLGMAIEGMVVIAVAVIVLVFVRWNGYYMFEYRDLLCYCFVVLSVFVLLFVSVSLSICPLFFCCVL